MNYVSFIGETKIKTPVQVCNLEGAAATNEREWSFSLLGALAILISVPLAGTHIPSERMIGKALAQNRDDDDRNGREHDDDLDSQRRHYGDQHFRIEVLSGRPDKVSGGDALVHISVKKKNVRLSDVRV